MAFRQLQGYQRRILDLTTQLVEEVDTELRFQRWSPTHYNLTPRQWQDPTNYGAWDGLPYYDFYSVYCRARSWKRDHQPGDLLVAIRFIADDGFNHSNPEPDPLKLSPPEKTNSILSVYRYQYIKPISEDWLDGAVGRNGWPEGESPILLDGACWRTALPFPSTGWEARMRSLVSRNAYGSPWKYLMTKLPSNSAAAYTYLRLGPPNHAYAAVVVRAAVRTIPI